MASGLRPGRDGAPAVDGAIAGNAAEVEPLQRPAPLRESVYEALTQMIIAGRLQPGQHLVEVELARLLGVSRQPVREALQRLHNDGWVDLRPGYGAMVHVPAEDEVDQLLNVRTVLESEAARLAATHATAEAIAELREMCATGTRMAKEGDIDGAVRVNGEFHRRIAELSGNRFLADFAAQVDRRVRWYYTPVAPARGQASWREHARVISAIADRDAEKASNVMREHTERTRKVYHETVAGEQTTEPARTSDAPRSRRASKR
jgi:DNA-binding GntR family transcriptional regulator